MKKITGLVISCRVFTGILILLYACEKLEINREIKIDTGSVFNITSTSAEVKGEILDMGESEIVEHGHCWSIHENPDIDHDPKTTLWRMESRGVFTSYLSSLKPGTMYYVCAYAKDARGKIWTDSPTFFATPGFAPEASFIASPTTIIVGQNVQFTDQSANTPTGWSWEFGDSGTSESENPSHTYSVAGTYTVTLTVTNAYGPDTETRNNYITVNSAAVTKPVAAFTASVTTLAAGQSVQFTDQSANTPTRWNWDFGDGGTDTLQNPKHTYSTEGTYTVTLTATNSFGSDVETKYDFITVSNESTTGTLTDDRDGHVYNWVKIGDQVWMSENLAYLPAVSPPASESMTDPYYYVYDYNGNSVTAAKATGNYMTYGVLYNWSAAMNGAASSSANPSGVQGACPSGWHLPGDDEWTELIDLLGGQDIAAGKLKEAGYEHWLNPNTGAVNSNGFTALPGGYRRVTGAFGYSGETGIWRTATESDDTDAYAPTLYYNAEKAYHFNYSKDYGFSVRCVRNN